MTSYSAIQRLAVPVAFCSVVVRRDAVAERFPGGNVAFDFAMQPGRGNDDLALLVRMSIDEAGLVFGNLHRAGLVPGEDFGLVDMRRGVMVPCHGVRAIGIEREPFVVEWAVQFDPDYYYQPGDVRFEWNAEPAAVPKVPDVAPAVEPEPHAVPMEAASQPWVRHVSRRGGLVHWTGGDDENEL